MEQGTMEHGRALLRELDDADAILVGAAAGMSAASGFDHYYRADERFQKYLGEFQEKYGFEGGFNGYYYRYPDSESRWAFLARSMMINLEAETGQTYIDLEKLLRGRNYHIMTTNQDFQFNHVMPEEKISAIQGDGRYLQCSRPCSDVLYNAEEIYRNLNDNIDPDLRVPTDMIPRCPNCGAELEPWMRGPRFLEGSKYWDEYRKVSEFLKDNAGRMILFLELGVGRMTPMFIQEPFWQLTYEMPNARYMTINPAHAVTHPAIEERSTVVSEDIAPVLQAALQAQEEKA